MRQVYRLAVLLHHYSHRLALCDIPPFDLISCSLFENPTSEFEIMAVCFICFRPLSVGCSEGIGICGYTMRFKMFVAG
jgi:hypothetical protein